MGLGSKIKKAVKKAIKNPLKYNPITALGRVHGEVWGAIKDNWTDIRTPLMYAGIAAAAAYTGGAALGALAGTGAAATGATAAAGAAGLGAATGVQANAAQKAADRAAKEQERIAAEEAEAQRRLSLQRAGATPDAVTDLNTEARRRMRSQAQRNMVSRNNANKLGGSSSTLA